MLLRCFEQVTFGHVEFAQDWRRAVSSSIMVHRDVNDKEVSLTGQNIIEHVLREKTVPLAQFVLEKGIEAILSATSVVSELRVRIFLQFGTLVFLVQTEERELVGDFFESSCVPGFDNAAVLAFAIKHDYNGSSKAT